MHFVICIRLSCRSDALVLTTSHLRFVLSPRWIRHKSRLPQFSITTLWHDISICCQCYSFSTSQFAYDRLHRVYIPCLATWWHIYSIIPHTLPQPLQPDAPKRIHLDSNLPDAIIPTIVALILSWSLFSGRLSELVSDTVSPMATCHPSPPHHFRDLVIAFDSCSFVVRIYTCFMPYAKFKSKQFRCYIPVDVTNNNRSISSFCCGEIGQISQSFCCGEVCQISRSFCGGRPDQSLSSLTKWAGQSTVTNQIQSGTAAWRSQSP